MRHFTANISFMFADRPFLDRIGAAKTCGLSHVECHFPYEFPIPVLKDRLQSAGVTLTGLNTAPGDVQKGEWGMAGMPGREPDFNRDFDQALEYASALGASVMDCFRPRRRWPAVHHNRCDCERADCSADRSSSCTCRR